MRYARRIRKVVAPPASSLPYGADEWRRVRSSNIKAVGRVGHYLLVQFHSGGTYAYPDQAIHFPNMVKARSVGSYFTEYVRAVADRTKEYSRLCDAGCLKPAAAGSTLCADCLQGRR